MSDPVSLHGLKSLALMLFTSFQGIDPDRVVSVIAALVFVGAFILQFFSIIRHRGRDAVISMLTWVLVACLCMAVAGYYWQQQRDFFQVVLLLFLTGGALSCFMLSAMSRQTLKEEAERRMGGESGVGPREQEMEQAAAHIRERLALARRRKEA